MFLNQITNPAFNDYCVNYLVMHILQNIFFCVQQKKESHTGLEQVNNGSIFILEWTVPSML